MAKIIVSVVGDSINISTVVRDPEVRKKILDAMVHSQVLKDDSEFAQVRHIYANELGNLSAVFELNWEEWDYDRSLVDEDFVFYDVSVAAKNRFWLLIGPMSCRAFLALRPSVFQRRLLGPKRQAELIEMQRRMREDFEKYSKQVSYEKLKRSAERALNIPYLTESDESDETEFDMEPEGLLNSEAEPRSHFGL